MPVLAANFRGDDIWRVSGPLHQCVLQNIVALPITWSDDDSVETIQRGTVVVTLPGLAETVDLSTKNWMVVTYKGATVDFVTHPLYFIAEGDLATIDTILATAPLSGTAKNWVKVRRHILTQTLDTEQIAT